MAAASWSSFLLSFFSLSSSLFLILLPRYERTIPECRLIDRSDKPASSIRLTELPFEVPSARFTRHGDTEYTVISAGNFRPGRGADGCRATAVGRAFGRAYFRATTAPQWHLVASTAAAAAADAANRLSKPTPGASPAYMPRLTSSTPSCFLFSRPCASIVIRRSFLFFFFPRFVFFHSSRILYLHLYRLLPVLQRVEVSWDEISFR